MPMTYLELCRCTVPALDHSLLLWIHCVGVIPLCCGICVVFFVIMMWLILGDLFLIYIFFGLYVIIADSRSTGNKVSESEEQHWANNFSETQTGCSL